MKKFLVLFLMVFSIHFAKSQTMPEAFISLLPNPPGGICNDGENDAKSAFMQQIGDVSKKLDEEISRRNQEIENNVDRNKSKMQQNAIARTGVSPQLMQQMMALEKASKGATGDQAKAYKEQKKALADQMIQQTSNISMGEIENLKKMDKAGKTAWAEAYATEKKAEVMADPKAYQQKAAADMKDYKLAEKQRQLADSLGAQVMKYMKQIEDLDKDQSAQAMLTQIDELEAKLNEEYKKENRPNDNAIKNYTNQIRDIQISYCNMQTPKYLDILSRYKSFTQASLTPYYRLEKLTNQVNATQTGVEINTQPGLMGLQQIMAYLSKLSDVYRYNHIRPKYVYIGAE
jgi:hypothetical protein